MDCTNFDFYPFHRPRPDVDPRLEIIRSSAATAIFLAVLGIAAVILAVQESPSQTGAATELRPATTAAVAFII